jgi:hypothetical protein
MRLQERIDTFEAEARGRLARACSTGNEKLVELDRALARVARDDWSVRGMRRQVERLRARADTLRADVVRRAGELPAEAVTKLVASSRTPVQTLAKGLADIAKRFEALPGPKAVEGATEEQGASGPSVAKAS